FSDLSLKANQKSFICSGAAPPFLAVYHPGPVVGPGAAGDLCLFLSPNTVISLCPQKLRRRKSRHRTGRNQHHSPRHPDLSLTDPDTDTGKKTLARIKPRAHAACQRDSAPAGPPARINGPGRSESPRTGPARRSGPLPAHSRTSFCTCFISRTRSSLA